MKNTKQTPKEIYKMSTNEMMNLIETMTNYDELAAKVKAKADAIRNTIKEEMELNMSPQTERLGRSE